MRVNFNSLCFYDIRHKVGCRVHDQLVHNSLPGGGDSKGRRWWKGRAGDSGKGLWFVVGVCDWSRWPGFWALHRWSFSQLRQVCIRKWMFFVISKGQQTGTWAPWSSNMPDVCAPHNYVIPAHCSFFSKCS